MVPEGSNLESLGVTGNIFDPFVRLPDCFFLAHMNRLQNLSNMSNQSNMSNLSDMSNLSNMSNRSKSIYLCTCLSTHLSIFLSFNISICLFTRPIIIT